MRFKVGDKVDYGFHVLTITQIGSFSSTEHYGFFGEKWNDRNQFLAGWMPVAIVDITAELHQEMPYGAQKELCF
jgi:hypothetical protein